MSPFLSAVAYVSALLGPADATEDIVEPYPATIARWGHPAGANLTVRHYGITGSVVLVAERRDDDREWRAIGDGTVRDACAWLSWEVPRPSRVGYDANGSPVGDASPQPDDRGCTCVEGYAPPDCPVHPPAMVASVDRAIASAREHGVRPIDPRWLDDDADDNCGGDQRSTTDGPMGEGEW